MTIKRLLRRGVCASVLLLICLLFSLLAGGFCTSVSADEGDLLWSRQYGGEEEDYIYSVIETEDNRFILAGATSSSGTGGWDMWLLALNSDGDSLWSETFGGENDEFAFEVVETPDGGLEIGGWTESFGGGESDVWLLKTDSQGDSLWSSFFGGSISDYCFSLLKTGDGNYLLGGATASFGSGGMDMFVVKTDQAGDSLWTTAQGGEGSEFIYGTVEADDGSYISVGTTSSRGAQSVDIWLVRIDADGDSAWSRTFGGSGEDCVYDVVMTDDGGFLLVGYSNSFTPSGDTDVFILKTDQYGDSLWSVGYGGEGNDFANGVAATSDGGYLIAGWSDSFGTGDDDIWLIKINSSGDSLWACTFGGSGDDYAYDVMQTADGNYLVAGETHSFGTNVWDAWLLCLEGFPIGVKPRLNVEPVSFSLLSVYPNPFNLTTAVRFALPRFTQVKLEVFDINGRCVKAAGLPLIRGYPPGTHEITFDGSGLPSGIYIISLESFGKSNRRKVILLK